MDTDYQDVQMPVQIHVAQNEFTMSDSSLKNFNVMSDPSKSGSEKKTVTDSNTNKILSYSNSKTLLTFGGNTANESIEAMDK